MAVMTSVGCRLSQQDLARYHRDGYLVVRQISPADDRAIIESLLMDLFRRHAELPREVAYELGAARNDRAAQVTPQIIGPSRLAPRLVETQYYRNAETIARQLLGDECYFKGDHAIYKPPHNNRETAWHQDLAYYAPEAVGHVVNFWLPLRDCPVETGCMWFVPQSHLGDLRPHHPVGHDPQMHTLETDGVDRSRAVACPLAAGDATLHTLKTLHYTGPNISPTPRLAYILAFGYEWKPDGSLRPLGG